MRRHIGTLMAAGLLLTGAYRSEAQECFECDRGHGAGAPGCYEQGSCCHRLWAWLTYRPVPSPHHCQCCRVYPTIMPPLYTYFIGEFGPASPLLAHHGDFAAHGDFHHLPLMEHGNGGIGHVTPAPSSEMRTGVIFHESRQATPAQTVYTVRRPSSPYAANAVVVYQESPVAAQGERVMVAPNGTVGQGVPLHAASSPSVVPIRDVLGEVTGSN
jgi:hypothetical protein